MRDAAQPWKASAVVLLVAVLMIGGGIIGILRVSYLQHPSWLLVIVPPVAVICGTVLLLVPLLRRLMREAAENEEAERRETEGFPRRRDRR